MMTVNNPFRCECCGATESQFDLEITVNLIGNNGVEYKKVCFDCACKIKATDPRYLHETKRYLDPEIDQFWKKQEEKQEKAFEQQKERFFESLKSWELVKQVVGTRRYEGFVDVTDPCYGSGSYDGKRIPIATGEYTCVAWDLNYNYMFDGEAYTASCVETMGIYLNGKIPAHDEMIYIGGAGVDAGLIGIFDVKDGLNLRSWLDEMLDNNDQTLHQTSIKDVGFITSLDDGGTSIYVFIENGEVVAVEIRYYDYFHRGQ